VASSPKQANLSSRRQPCANQGGGELDSVDAKSLLPTVRSDRHPEGDRATRILEG